METTHSHSKHPPGLDPREWPWKIESSGKSEADGPTISIITPSFNQVDYIESTLLSVLNQSYPSIEYIVMDGGSSDGSAEVIQKYGERLDGFESTKDKGQADAINKGIRKAGGEWIAFINSDDFFLADALTAVAEKLKVTKCRWLAGGVRILGDDGTDYGNRYPEINHPGDLRAWLTYENQVPQQGCFIHHSVFDEVGLFDLNLHNAFDLDFWVKMNLAGISPETLEKPIAVFRIQDLSKSMTGRLPFIEDHRRILHKNRNRLSEGEYRKISKKLDGMEADSRIYSAAGMGEQKDRSGAVNQLGNALRLRKSIGFTRPFWGAVKRVLMGA